VLNLVLENGRLVDATGNPCSSETSGSKTARQCKWEGSLIASDSLHDQAEKPHSRLYGAFPHVLARYVREKRLLFLEESIRKIISFPARRFNLSKRGSSRKGTLRIWSCSTRRQSGTRLPTKIPNVSQRGSLTFLSTGLKQ